MVFGLAGCGTSQEDVDTTVSTAIAPISEQITAINTSIDDLKAVDTALDGYIDALETKTTELEANDTLAAEEITAIKATIETLKSKDTELEGKIKTLENHVNTELSETEDWAEATFATLAQYAEIQTEISNIKATLTTLVDTTALSTAISTSETSMKEWVNETLADGYYTIAEIDTKLTDLETKLAGADDTLEASIEEQKKALATAKTELTTAYTTAISEAIETNNGVINTKIANDIATAKEELQTQIDGINAEITTLKADITALNSAVSALQDKIAELENRINCLEGKHVINEALPTSYTYTWSETAPTSTKNYTCLHCGKVIEETVSPSVWSVGDKVTYVAKDGNSYVSTVGGVTDGKAVLINETVNTVEYTYDNWTDEKVLALLDNVGARYPSESEAVATLYQAATDPYVDSNDLTSAKYRYLAVYQEDTTVMYRYYGSSIWNYKERSYWGSFNNRTATLYYCYVWDIPITTAE
jgi:chromosome segregation ATPase